MNNNLIPVAPFTPRDIASLECIRTGQLSMGKFTRQFEQAFAKHVGAKYAVMVNSGSSANLLALSALKALHPEIRTVGLPAVTWSTTLAPIVQLGLTPCFFDVELDTLTLRDTYFPCDVLFNVHLLGQPSPAMVNMTSFVLEDCCESLGTHDRDGHHVGTRCTAGTFSFFYSHQLVTIEGGMVVTSSEDYYEELVMQRAHGWIRDLPEDRREYWQHRHPDIDHRFLFPTLGYNMRPTEINAELGLMQLPHLEQWHQRRLDIALRMRAATTDGFIPYRVNSGRHSWFAYPLLLERGGLERRTRLVKHFEMADIPTRPIVAGDLTSQPFMAKFGLQCIKPLNNSRYIQHNGIYLAISPFMTDEYVSRVCDAIAAWE